MEDPDGIGFQVLLRDLGFDEDGWRQSGEKRLVLYTAERGLETLEGPHSQALAAHQREFAIPAGQHPQPQVVVRSARPEGPTSDGGSWLGRLFRRFRG